jgi:hypothetical protein
MSVARRAADARRRRCSGCGDVGRRLRWRRAGRSPPSASHRLPDVGQSRPQPWSWDITKLLGPVTGARARAPWPRPADSARRPSSPAAPPSLIGPCRSLASAASAGSRGTPYQHVEQAELAFCCVPTSGGHEPDAPRRRPRPRASSVPMPTTTSRSTCSSPRCRCADALQVEGTLRVDTSATICTARDQ